MERFDAMHSQDLFPTPTIGRSSSPEFTAEIAGVHLPYVFLGSWRPPAAHGGEWELEC